MRKIYSNLFYVCVGTLVSVSAFALADAEAERAYALAAKTMVPNMVKTADKNPQTATNVQGEHAKKSVIIKKIQPLDVSIISDTAQGYRSYMQGVEEIPLEEVVLAIDVDNVSIEDIIGRVIKKAESRVGPWSVKWRLKPENTYLKEERVNLIAESTLGKFLNLMTDRVRNMTGVQLFVSVFGTSRIIIISDTYSS